MGVVVVVELTVLSSGDTWFSKEPSVDIFGREPVLGQEMFQKGEYEESVGFAVVAVRRLGPLLLISRRLSWRCYFCVVVWSSQRQVNYRRSVS
jgi:hypothetical protein